MKYQYVLRNLNVLDYEYSFSLVEAFLKGDYSSAFLTFDEILVKGFNALHFVAALSSHLRDLIVSKSGGLDSLLELPQSLKVRYKEQADRCTLQFLYEALAITTQCESGYRASVNPRLHIEFALMRLSLLCGKLNASASPSTPAVSAAPSAPTAAPSVPTAAPVVSAPAKETVPVSPTAAETVQSEPAPQRRTRANRTAASLSMKSMMGASEEKTETVETDLEAPSDDVLVAKWPELAKSYESKPRLASTLSSSTLTIGEGEDGTKVVTFCVVNEAQKEWVESKLLHELEGNFRRITGSTKICLRVSVAADDSSQTAKVYMPSDQAKALMAQNEEVKNLVQDLELDIK